MWNVPLGVTAVMLPELDLPEQLALCRKLGLTHYTLRPRIIAPADRDKPYSNWGNHKFDLTPQRLVREATVLRRQIEDAGLVPFGTVPNATTADPDDQIRLHLEGAAAVGAGRVRIAPAPYPSGPFDYPSFLDQVINRYHQIVQLARSYRLKIVIETHCRSLAASPALAWNICRHFDPADLGVIFDLPNFAREGNYMPNLAVAVIGRWIDHCHVGGARRVHTGRDPQGFAIVQEEFCSLPEGDLHIPTWLKALRDAQIHVPLIIEDFTPGLPGAQRLEATAADLRQALESL